MRQPNKGSGNRYYPVNRLVRPLAAFSIALLLLSLGVCLVRASQYRALKKEEEELQKQVNECRDAIEEMEDALDGKLTRKNVERLAHEKLHLYYPDEVIYYSDINY